ncbi:MAG: hypothetical protein ACK5UK_01610 [bacterium]
MARFIETFASKWSRRGGVEKTAYPNRPAASGASQASLPSAKTATGARRAASTTTTSPRITHRVFGDEPVRHEKIIACQCRIAQHLPALNDPGHDQLSITNCTRAAA